MKRRKFLQTSSAISLPILLNGMPVGAMPQRAFFSGVNNDNDRVLVLIQLNGGNDGLSTLFPLDQYDKLANVRSNIIIPENQLISLTDTIALHPSMTGIKGLYDDARLGIVQSVGYPNQNRSHFRSTDIWTTGSAADEFLTTGWVGRYFDNRHPTFPEDYPNDDYPDPFAIAIGHVVSETCQGVSSNFSMALNDPFALAPITGGVGSEVPDRPYGYELNFLRETISQSNAYAETVTAAANNASNLSTLYADDNTLAQQLKIVAQLIAGGLGTKVYVVSLGGFDTHANQVQGGDVSTGIHAQLLNELSEATFAFQDDLQLLGLEERVVSMTFSEFGRRIRSNDSLGTDHGTAAPLIVFGACVNPMVFGENPEIPDEVGTQDGVPMQYDFRSVYGSVLMDWFDVPEAEVRSLLYEEFQYIPILQVCNVTTSSTDLTDFGEELEAYNYPNPFNEWTTLVFHTKAEWARVSIYDSLGHELRVLAEGQFNAGEHKIQFEARDLNPGNYYLHIRTRTRQKTKMIVRI
ncbi:MAG: DUF1501 domain-containing protein [Bacteroidota bacterium]